MKYIKSFTIFESELGRAHSNQEIQIPSKQEILRSIEKNFPEYSKPGSVFPVDVKDSTGKLIQTLEFKFDENGELQINDGVYENKFTKGLATLCLIGGMLTSCQKDDLYNIANDPRYIVKPQILNTLGKENFDSPVPNKENMYVWFGNRTGASGQERHGYFDFTNKKKTYGEKFVDGNSTDYPDSIGDVFQFLIPSEVIETNTTEETPFPLTAQQREKYKYIVLIKVHKPTAYDWSDAFKGKEIPSSFGGTKLPGYAIYLTNLETIQPGEVYPTLLDYIFDQKDDMVLPLKNYKIFGGEHILTEKPNI
jgi:hypothetical protein